MTNSEIDPPSKPVGSEADEVTDDSEATASSPVNADATSDPEAPLYSTVPLEDEDGNEYVIQQQNVGRENMKGGGEWPDPDTPPESPAPGSAES